MSSGSINSRRYKNTNAFASFRPDSPRPMSSKPVVKPEAKQDEQAQPTVQLGVPHPLPPFAFGTNGTWSLFGQPPVPAPAGPQVHNYYCQPGQPGGGFGGQQGFGTQFGYVPTYYTPAAIGGACNPVSPVAHTVPDFVTPQAYADLVNEMSALKFDAKKHQALQRDLFNSHQQMITELYLKTKMHTDKLNKLEDDIHQLDASMTTMLNDDSQTDSHGEEPSDEKKETEDAQDSEDSSKVTE